MVTYADELNFESSKHVLIILEGLSSKDELSFTYQFDELHTWRYYTIVGVTGILAAITLVSVVILFAVQKASTYQVKTKEA